MSLHSSECQSSGYSKYFTKYFFYSCTVMCCWCTVGDRTSVDNSRIRHLSRPNDCTSETVTEHHSSRQHRPTRRSSSKDADVMTDEHCDEGDKQLLHNSSSSRLANDIISSTEPHNYDDTVSSLKSTDGYDSKSPTTALINDDIGKQPWNTSHLPSSVNSDLSKQQKCFFKTARWGIEVFVYTGDLLQEKVDAIVNPADISLIHHGGAAKAIATAAGRQLQDECEEYVRRKGPLNVTEVMHTSAGSLRPNVLHVIHAASCSAKDRDPDKYHVDLRTTFYNCLRCANDVLKLRSMAIPAVGAGWYCI